MHANRTFKRGSWFGIEFFFIPDTCTFAAPQMGHNRARSPCRSIFHNCDYVVPIATQITTQLLRRRHTNNSMCWKTISSGRLPFSAITPYCLHQPLGPSHASRSIGATANDARSAVSRLTLVAYILKVQARRVNLCRFAFATGYQPIVCSNRSTNSTHVGVVDKNGRSSTTR